MHLRILMVFSTLLLMIGALQASSSPLEDCPITPPVDELPPEENTASWSNIWYRSDDGELWADAGRRFADGTKVLWRKPTGSALEVTGRRLDGDAPPMEASIPEGYGGSFQASGLIFPTAGCWEVEARAENSTLTFVNYVYPKGFYQSRSADFCEQLTGQITVSDLIFTGIVEGNVSVLGDEYRWETVRAEQVWKGTLRRGERIEILRDAAYTAPMEYGASYLLFLQAVPGYQVQALCPLARIDGEQIVVDIEWGALITGQNLDDLIAQIEAAL